MTQSFDGLSSDGIARGSSKHGSPSLYNASGMCGECNRMAAKAGGSKNKFSRDGRVHYMANRPKGGYVLALRGVGGQLGVTADLENASPVQAMTLLVEGDLGRHSVQVGDIREAADRYRDYVEANDLGSSQVSFGKVTVGGKLVATVRYNGTVVLENAGKDGAR